MSEREVLYIPGLGGKRSLRVQRPYLRTLKVFSGKSFHFFETKWEDQEEGKPETNNAKYQRLNDFFDERNRPGIIYANSAGAALAARLAIERSSEIKSCHLICGKVLGASKIGTEYKERAPAFEEAVIRSEQAVANLDTETAQKIFCYVPKDREDDGVLEVIDMIVPGANIVELPPLPHTSAIIYAARHYLPKL